jgi:hypothetical protein
MSVCTTTCDAVPGTTPLLASPGAPPLATGLAWAVSYQAIQCHFIAAQFHVEANGVTRYGLSHGAIKGVSIPLPPPAEQAAIVRFLDWANGRLERDRGLQQVARHSWP